jgi:hypothetical protein
VEPITDTKSGDDGAESLRRATEAQEEIPKPAEPAQVEVVAVVPNPWIVQALGKLTTDGLALSRKAGWSSPAAPPLLSEEKWVEIVSQSTAVIVARRFPRLNDEGSEEFVLLALFLPWFATNLIGMLWKMYQLKKHPELAQAAAKPEEKAVAAA